MRLRWRLHVSGLRQAAVICILFSILDSLCIHRSFLGLLGSCKGFSIHTKFWTRISFRHQTQSVGLLTAQPLCSRARGFGKVYNALNILSSMSQRLYSKAFRAEEGMSSIARVYAGKSSFAYLSLLIDFVIISCTICLRTPKGDPYRVYVASAV